MKPPKSRHMTKRFFSSWRRRVGGIRFQSRSSEFGLRHIPAQPHNDDVGGCNEVVSAGQYLYLWALGDILGETCQTCLARLGP